MPDESLPSRSHGYNYVDIYEVVEVAYWKAKGGITAGRRIRNFDPIFPMYARTTDHHKFSSPGLSLPRDKITRDIIHICRVVEALVA